MSSEIIPQLSKMLAEHDLLSAEDQIIYMRLIKRITHEADATTRLRQWSGCAVDAAYFEVVALKLAGAAEEELERHIAQNQPPGVKKPTQQQTRTHLAGDGAYEALQARVRVTAGFLKLAERFCAVARGLQTVAEQYANQERFHGRINDQG